MSYRIRAGEADKFFERDSAVPELRRIQQLIVETPTADPLLFANVMTRGTDAARIFRSTGTELDELRLNQALTLHAIPVIEEVLRDARYDTEKRAVPILLSGAELAAAAAALGASKVCRYRLHERGDDYCDAGVLSDGGAPTRWATSRNTCSQCDAPDTRLACANLHHVRTASFSSATGTTIAVVHCECDLGKPEVHPKKCTFGHLECWEQRVEIVRQSALSLPPLALHASVDYFDAVWRNAFGRPLLTMSVLTPGGVLATPCTSSQDFQAKLSAIGDVFNAFDPQHQVKGLTGSLANLRAKLAEWGAKNGAAPEDIASMERAVLMLQRTLGLRAAQQHGPTCDRYEQAIRALGVSLPPASYSDEWNRLQTVLHDAFADLRRFIRERV